MGGPLISHYWCSIGRNSLNNNNHDSSVLPLEKGVWISCESYGLPIHNLCLKGSLKIWNKCTLSWLAENNTIYIYVNIGDCFRHVSQFRCIFDQIDGCTKKHSNKMWHFYDTLPILRFFVIDSTFVALLAIEGKYETKRELARRANIYLLVSLRHIAGGGVSK